MSQLSDNIRTLFKSGDDVRDAGLTTPNDVERFDDIPYGPDPARQSLDVYRPIRFRGRKLPVIVSIHGGGWVYGDKERYQYYCMSLAQRGFAVVNFTYRLAPEAKFPAQVEDTNTVFTWVLDNAAKYGFDAHNVFGVGDSAGAQLLCLYAAVCTDPSYAALFPFRVPVGFAPRAVNLNCGVYEMKLDEESLTQGLMGELLAEKGSPREVAWITTLPHVTGSFPPAFVMTANDDFLKNDAPKLVSRLMEVSVPFVFRFYGTPENKLGHVFHCNMKTSDAILCNDEVCDFFRRMIVEK